MNKEESNDKAFREDLIKLCQSYGIVKLTAWDVRSGELVAIYPKRFAIIEGMNLKKESDEKN